MDTTRMMPEDDRTKAVNPVSDATQSISNAGIGTVAFSTGPSVTFEIIPGNKYALSTEQSREHFLAVARSKETALGRRLPLNICLIIDRSGSMEGEPLEYVKRACSYVVDILEPNDILSIVVFEERAEVLMPARRVVNKALVKEHIFRIEPGTTTNIYDGIASGCSQIAAVPLSGYVNRAILFTDGEPTAGQKDYSSIVNLAAEQKSRGITITALGFGPEYNEELVAGIARRTGGNYYYITRPDLIPEVFRRELETMMTVVARNLKIILHLSKWVHMRQIYGKQPAVIGKTVECVLPDLERGSAASALIELDFEPRPSGTYRVARAELAFEDSSTGRLEKVSEELVLSFVTDSSLVQENINPVVKQEIEIAEASRNLERTVMGLRTQQIAPHIVASELERTKVFLISQGKTAEAADIQKAIDDLKAGNAGVEKTLVGTIYDLDRGGKKK